MPRRRKDEQLVKDRIAATARSWLPLLVVLAGLAAYATSFDGVCVFDDVPGIVENESIRDLLKPADILRHDRRPVVNLSLAVNYAFGKLEVVGYHAFNLAVHILAALTLYGLVRRTLLLGALPERMSDSAPWFATAAAVIWVVHPLNTQAVTYVTQRAESMAGLFYLLTLYCSVRGLDSARRGRWYVGAVAACALGMGCKGMMVTAPLMVLLYDWVFVGRPMPETLRRRWVLYLGLAATWGVLAATGMLRVLVPEEGGRHVGFGVPGVTALDYLLTQPGVILHYLRLCFWPHPLCLDYNWPLAGGAAEIVPAGLLILALLGGTVWALLRRSWLGFAGAWLFLILAPTSSFIPIKDPSFEHRMYLPLAAAVVIVIAAARLILRRLTHGPGAASRGRLAGAVLVGVTTTSLGALTAVRNCDYHNRESLWRSVVEAAPDNPRGWNGLGFAIETQGRPQDAIEYYLQALEIDPDYPEAYYNLGNALQASGRLDEAIEQYREALRARPAYPEAINNLGNTLYAQGNLKAAVEVYERAVQIDPNAFRFRKNLANALASSGRLAEAILHYTEALRIQPDDFDIHMNLGAAYGSRQRNDRAIAHLRRAVQIRPASPDAHFNLAAALWLSGSRTRAINHYREALRLNPTDSEVRRRLAEALQEVGRAEEARAILNEAAARPESHTPR